MTYDDSNSGALFKNDKEGNDKRPDYKGPLNVNGAPHEVAAWLKEDRNGRKYMSLKIQPKMDKGLADRGRPGNPPAPDDDFGDSEIPF